MTKAIWGQLLKNEYGRKYINGDMICVTYISNWAGSGPTHSGKGKRNEYQITSRIWWLDERGVRFINGKRLSYKSIIKIERIQ